ncbi:MAG TPA: hypothetical protein VNN15_06260 [Solirubrobacterales bacterium]|nr:hypothetical protein [Solirubrobacterales bacterium]
MEHKLRVLALALMALMATGAMTASAASAGQFTAESYPATITGTQLSGHEFGFFGYTITCNKASLDAPLGAAATSLTVSASYKECSSSEGGEVTVKMTSCDYVFNAGNELDATMDVKCGAGGTIDFEDLETGCSVEILPQGTLSTLTYTNHPEAKDFDVDIKVGPAIKYEQDAQCPGGAGFYFNGTYKGQSTMTADHEGAGTGVTVD